MTFATQQRKARTATRWPVLMRWTDRLLYGLSRKPGRAKRLEKQLKDFVSGGIELYWKRQSIYLAAAMLCGIYYSAQVSAACYAFCQLTEFLDTMVSRKVAAWEGGSYREGRRYLRLLLMTSTLSSISVSLFVYIVAYMEGISSHFTPLFFLFAAGLFAAVNNHQLPQVLAVRLLIYGAVFLYIPIHDIWVVRPPFDSVLWLQFATVIFVLYFVLECSFIFLRLYRKGLDQLDELRLERDRAQAAYEVKSQFVSVVSHELRTPLTSINGALSLLRSGAFKTDPDRAASILEIAHKNSVRLSMLINDLLDLQKLESGQMTYRFELIDICEVVKEAAGSIGVFADGFGINVQFDPPAQAMMVRADHDRLLQVFDNLFSNAVKFSRRGGTVEISIEQSGGDVRVSVTDSGIGIPENSREKVFGRFSQVDSSDRRSHGGTGLGLSIAQEIMTAHDGVIDYVSRLGEGTTFFIQLPITRP
jgi:signal transduction histidine kinase